MPRLLGIRFESVGHRDARLDGLVLALHADGAPADSVVWLRNGGGKSSILNLIFSVLRPNLREFLGSEADAKARRLEDYVAAEDTATVCLAWELDGDGKSRPILFTVGVYYWSGSENTTLVRRWFALRVDPTRRPDITLESLPLLDETGGTRRPLRHAALRDRLFELHSPPDITFTSVTSQVEWEELLESYGLDPHVFSYQLRMNRSEGAADQLFRHRSAEQLVDFLIEILLSPEEAEAVRETLREYASQIARRPHLERELAACGAAAGALGPLAEIATELRDARADIGGRASSLRAVLERVKAVHASKVEEAGEIKNALERLAERSRHAAQQRNAAHVNAGVYEAEAATLERREAEDQLRAATSDRDRTRDALHALRAAEALVDVRRIEAVLGVKRGELARRLDQSRPVLDELRAVAGALAGLLRADRERITARATLADLAVSRAEGERDACALKRDAALGTHAELRERVATLERSVDVTMSKWEALEKRGDLLAGERPRAALARLRSVMELEVAAEKVARAQAATLNASAKDARKKVLTLRGEASASRAHEASLGRELDAAEKLRLSLTGDEALRAILGDDEPDVVRLGAEIAVRVRNALTRLREQLLRLAVEAREDTRALDWLERHGLLPATIDAEVVRDELRNNNIQAHTGNMYLAENRRGEAAAARAAAQPALAGGVVVDAADEARAREYLLSAKIRVNTPLAVGTTASLLDAPADGAFAVLPPTAFWDRDAARAEYMRRDADRAQKKDRRISFERQESATETVLRKLESFVGTHTEAWYARVREERAGHTATEGRATADADELERRAEQMTAEAAAQYDEADRRAAQQKLVNASASRVEAFVEDGEALDRVRADLEETRRARDQASESERTHAEQLRKLIDVVKERESDARDLSAQGSVLEEEIDTVSAWIEPEGQLPSTETRPIEELRARFKHLHRDYESRTARESLQGEISTLEGERDVARGRLTKARGRLPEQDVARALDDAESGVGLVEATRRADDAAEKAGQRVGAMTAESKSAALRADAAQSAVQNMLDRGRSTAVLEARTRARDLDVATLRSMAERERELGTRASTEETDCETQRREAQGRSEVIAAAMERLTAHDKLIGSEREHFAEIEAAVLAFDRTPVPIAGLETDAELDAAVESAVREVRASSKRIRALVARVGEIMRRLADDASADAAASLPQMLRDRLRESDLETAVRRAADLLADVEVRRGAVEEQLGQLDQHRRLIAQGLGRATDKAIDLLKRLERSSVFPSHIKIWGDQPFLKVRLSVPEPAAEKDAAIFAVIDRAAAAAQVPAALQLVQACVRELTRPSGIAMQMLKPEVHRRLEWVPIEDINKFSGGERITAAILLYATVAQLRAKQRGKIKAPTSVLLLDNPVGACSHPEFLELQREMARASGVQLIYTTGVDDLEALARLPNVVRLRNARRDTRARRRVTLDGPAMEAVHVAWTKG